MLDWIMTYQQPITLFTNVAMVVIWMTYLQLIYLGFRRANRAVIHIDRAASESEAARCIVANMGSDTVFILGVKVDLQCEDGGREALVTDRLERDGPLGGDYREKSNKGPLKGGEVWDIGSFAGIVERAAYRMGEEITVEACKAVEITVVVAAHQAHRLLGGSKRFDIVRRDGGSLQVTSPQVLTPQLGGWRERRRLLREIAG